MHYFEKISMNGAVTVKITAETAKKLGIDINTDQQSGKIEQVGPWGIIKSFTALCIKRHYDDKSMFTKVKSIDLIGIRKMGEITQQGYGIKGRVSVGGKKAQAWDTSQLFEVDGKLIDVACIAI